MAISAVSKRFPRIDWQGALAILICLLFQVGVAQAQEGGGANVGLAYGMSVPDADNTNPHHLFGVTGAAKMGAKFSIGGYYFVTGAEEGKGGRDFSYSIHGIKVVYAMGEGRGNTYLGGMAGMSKIKTKVSNQDAILSPYHYGLVAGHDYGLTGWFSVGFEGFFVRLQDSTTTVGSTPYREESLNIISFLATTKLQF